MLVRHINRTVNIPGFWISRATDGLPIFIIWQSFEYVSGFNCERVLNILGFRICQISPCVSVTQGSDNVWIWMNNAWISNASIPFWLWQGSGYAWSKLHSVLKNPPVLNMPQLRMWKGCKYARVTQDAKYTWINVNMH